MSSSVIVTAALAAGAWAALSTAPTGEKDWYWQNPEPQGNTLLRITSAGDDSLWTVGGPGVVLHSDTGGIIWESQDPGTLEVLRATDFVSTATGWVVGDNGTVRKTVDGGATWAAQSIEDPQSDLSGVTMVDASTGWVCASDGTLRTTTNGGTSWTTQADLEVRLNDIDSVDASRTWAVGESGSVRATSDGGSTWTTQTTPASVELRAVDFADSSLGIAVGDEGTVLRTSDGGATWAQIVSIGTSEDITDVHLRSATTGWIVARDGSVFYTTSGGTTWTPVTTAGHTLRGITAIEGGAAVAVGDDGFMFRSPASGQPWVAENTELANLRDLAFDSPLQGCAVGAAGAVLHTTDGGATWTAVDSGTTASLHGVDCVASGKGWIVGASGTIRSSVDATSWVGQSASVPTSETLYAVDALDDDYGWIVGSNATVLRTSNGGSESWLAADVVPSEVETLYAVSFVDTATGCAVGEGGRIIKTVDGGATWDLVPDVPTSDTLRGVSFVTSSTVGYAAGDGGVVLKTTDSGDTWVAEDTGIPSGASLTGIHALSENQVTVVGGETGSPSLVARITPDSGGDWLLQTTGALGRPQAVRVIDADNAWVAGEGGMILKSTNDLPPLTALEVSPPVPDGADGWYISPPVITLTSDEPGISFYSWVSQDGPWKTYLQPFTPDEGEATFYYYSVDPGGNAEDPQEAEFKYDGTAPTTPTITAVSAESSSAITVEFNSTTDDGSGLDYYELRSGGSVVATTTQGIYTVTDLDAETSYAFTVRAFDVAGNASAVSDVVTGTTMGAFARPPTAVYARSMGIAGAAVDWDEPTATIDPVQYRVWRSNSGAPFSAIATVAVGRYLDATPPHGQELRYAISVVDARGEGPMSAPTAYSTTVSDDPPPAPVEITARNTASVTVTWSPSPAAAGYHVYRSSTSTGVATTLTAAPIAVATYHDDTTAPYTEYWYSVASVDASDVVGVPSPRAYIRTDAGDTSSTVEPPHGAYNTDTDMCALCHATHTATSPLSLMTGTTTNDAPLCLSCHDGTSASDVLSDYLDSTRTSRHAVPFEEISGDLNCSDCHGVHSSEQTATVKGLLLAGGTKSGNAYCYECHGEDADAGPRGDLRVFEASAHGAGVMEPPTGTKVVCLTCHISHTSREASLIPYSADDRCLGCHTAGLLTGGATDIAGKLDGDGADTRHDLRSADSSQTGSRLSCANCHEPHTSTATTPCVDPDSPTTTSTIAAGSVTLCLRCHDDELPTAQDTSGWVEAPLAAGGATVTVNVASSWETTSFHGTGASVSPQLRNDMGYAKGDALVCADCHDPHGTSNRFSLRETINAKTGPLEADLLLVVPVGASGADLRFFCDSCHEVTVATHTAADLSQWPLDCTPCHEHVGGGL